MEAYDAGRCIAIAITITITIAITRQQQSCGIVARQNQGLALLEQFHECEGCRQTGRTK